MPGTSNRRSYSPAQAHYVLGRLVDERKVNDRQIVSYLNELQREIENLESRINELKAAHTGGGAAARRGPQRAQAQPQKRGGRPRKRARALSPEAQASRRLQGEYISLIRQIPKTKRGPYQEIVRQKGREEAIKRLRMALKK